MNKPVRQRREVYYSGRVQGVGFRLTAFQVAQKSEIVGTVRNLDDGRVHLVAEGAEEELNRFLAEITRRLGSNIETADAVVLDATGQLTDFAIIC